MVERPYTKNAHTCLHSLSTLDEYWGWLLLHPLKDLPWEGKR